MNRIKYVLLTCFLLFTASLNAGWVDKQGNQVPDSNDMKSVGKLIAHQIITDNEAEALKNWETPSETVYLPTAEQIERNKIITAFIVFAGCSVDTKGHCDLRMQITVYQPDGAIYANIPIAEVWAGKPPLPNNNLGLSVDYLRIRIEPDEQLGKYQIDTKVVDKISGNNMLLTSYFTAIEAK